MAISSFQRPAASSGNSSKTVASSSGTFTIDPGEADNFYLDFADSYFFQPVGEITPQFVGAYRTSNVNGGNMTVSFSALNVQGIGSSVQQDDHVFLVVSTSDISAEPTNQTVSQPYLGGTWSLLAGGDGNDSRDLYTNVYYAKIEGAPATSVTVDPDSNQAVLAIAYVFRGGRYNGNIDQDTIINTSSPNPPSITTNRDNSLVLAIGSRTGTGILASPGGGIADFVTIGSDDSDGVVAAVAYISTTTAGTYDPPAFDTSVQSTSDATVSFSIELEVGDAYNDSATINFTNISDQEVKDCFVYFYMDRLVDAGDISLTWDARAESIATSPLPSTLKNGVAQSYDFFAYNNNVFLYEKVTKPKIQKTEFIKSTTSWTAPSDVSEVEILICGGGGSAGDSETEDGGGGGSAFEDVLQVTPGQSYTITIGAGASGSTTSNGNNGSSSSFGSLFTATGGEGGSGGRGGYGAGLGGHGASYSAASPDSFSAQGEGLKGYGRGGTIGNQAAGAPNSGQGGSNIFGTSANGGSGICIIKYWTAT